jgi:hypothetical protein
MSAVYELTLANGQKMKAEIKESLFFGKGLIWTLAPMWKVENGLCDFFFYPEDNEFLDKQGLNVTHVNGVDISQFVYEE